MYFFADPNHLIATAQQYGPVSTSIFNTGAQFDLSSSIIPINNERRTKAYACQKGQVIVVTSLFNADRVNVILKPTTVHKVNLKPVKYYIYRGLAKDSFLDAFGDVKGSIAGSNSDFLEQFWKYWTEIVGGAIPSKEDIGFADNIPTSVTDVNLLFKNIVAPQNNLTILARSIEEGGSLGEWVQAVSGTPIELEIVFDVDPSYIDIDYIRADTGNINLSTEVQAVNNAPSSSALLEAEFILKVAKTKVFNHIDPAAFFGMHYKVGVGYYNSTTGLSDLVLNTVLYSEVLKVFDTKNRVYIDIRSEWGYPYNFYENYADGTGKNIKIKSKNTPTFTEETYNKSFEWPLYYVELTTNHEQFILKLRTDENEAPLLYLEDVTRFGKGKRTKPFLRKARLNPITSNGWTTNIRLNAFREGTDFVATYLQLYYFRQKSPSATNNDILRLKDDLDTYFGSIDLLPAGAPPKLQQGQAESLQLIQGSGFSYLTHPELYKDAQSAVFITRLLSAGLSDKRSNDRWPKERAEGDVLIEDPLFPNDILFSSTNIVENTATSNNPPNYNSYLQILDIASYGGSPSRTTRQEDCLILALTAAQHDTLLTVSSNLSNLHARHLVFKEVGGTIHRDIIGIPFKKYELHIQGLDAEGEVPPSIASNIFVYSLNDYVFSSKEFTSNANITQIVAELNIPDPTRLKPWKHVGQWATVVENTGITVSDHDNSSGLPAPFAIDYAARAYFPTDSVGVTDPEEISTSQTNYPLIVVVHGNGQMYTSYDFLLKHLAHNGFIAVSIDCTIARDRVVLRPLTPSVGNYSQIAYALKPYGYNSNTEEFCLYDSFSNSFPAQNIMPWKIGADFTIAGSTVTFRSSIRIHGNAHGMGARGRAETLFHMLNLLRNTFTVTNSGNTSYKIANDIGLIGHSRGGEAILTAERLIGNQNGTGTNSVVDLTATATLPALNNITALFSLAPTDQYRVEELDGVPHFVLYGSHDADVAAALSYPRAFPSGAPTTIVSGTGFSLWERTVGAEKFMAFVQGATHNGFATKNREDYNKDGYFYDTKTTNWVRDRKYIGKKAHINDFVANESIQRTLLKGFANAFFRCYQKSESFWPSLLRGDQLPRTMNKKNIKIEFQYKRPGGSVIQNYSDPSLQDFNPNTGNELVGIARRDRIAPTLTPPTVSLPLSSINDVIQFTAYDIETWLDFFSPHALHSKMIEYSTSNNIVEIYNSGGGGGLSSVGFAYLSFRIAIVFDYNFDYNNSPPTESLPLMATIESNNLEVELEASPTNISRTYSYPNSLYQPFRRYDINGYRTEFLHSVSGLPWPNLDIQQFLSVAKTKSSMVTIRVPLDDFGYTPSERGDIRRISLRFGGGAGIVAISDFEFTN